MGRSYRYQIADKDGNAPGGDCRTGGLEVRNDGCPEGMRIWPLGFDSGEDIPVGGTVTIEGEPQELFRGKAVAWPSANAEDFVIEEMKVGTQSQMLDDTPVPAQVFSEVSEHTCIQFDTSQPGIKHMFRVTNIGTTAQRARFAVFGYTQVVRG